MRIALLRRLRAPAPLAAPYAALLGLLLWLGGLGVAAGAALGLAAPAPEPQLVDFYPPERNAAIDYRFARPEAALLLPAGAPPGSWLVLRVFSPPPLPARELVVAEVGGSELLRSTLGAEPRLLRLALPARAAGRGLALSLRSPGAVATGDLRDLGLLYEEVRLVAGPFTPPWGRIAWLALAPLLAGGLALAALAGRQDRPAARHRQGAGVGARAAPPDGQGSLAARAGRRRGAGGGLGLEAAAQADARRGGPIRWDVFGAELAWPLSGGLALGAAMLAAADPGRAAWLIGGLALALVAARAVAPAPLARLHTWLRSYSLSAPAWATAALVSAWAAWIGWHALANHRLYGTNTYDLGLYDQTFWLISRGLPSYSTGAGLNMLGSHAALVLYPLATLYWLLPDVRLLLLFQALVTALGAVPLYLLGRDRAAPWLGLAAGAAYLLHPATQNMALFDFHVDTLAASVMLVALWAADARRWGVTLACCALVIACKENFAVTTAFFGLWLVGLRREWRWGLLLLLASTLWFLFATQLLVPGLIGRDESLHVGRFSKYGDSVPAILLTALTRPQLLVADLWPPQAPAYLAALLLPLALLPLLSPYALLALPGLAINLLSAEPLQRGLLHHYSALVVAALALASLDGALRLRDWLTQAAAGWTGARAEAPGAERRALRRGWWLVVAPAALLAALAGLLLLSAGLAQASAPLRRNAIVARLERQPPEPALYDYLLGLIPPQAGVAAQGQLQPHLTHRQQAYLYPNPFMPAEFFHPAGMPFAPAVEYVIYDTRRFDRFGATPEAKAELLRALRDGGGYRELARLDGVVLLRRLPAGAMPYSNGRNG